MVLLKKFLLAFAIALYSVVPVFAGDSDRVRSHWQWQGAKMLNFTSDQQIAWEQLKKAHLKGMRTSVRGLRLAKERLRIAFQSSAGEEGLISRHKGEAEIRNQAAALFSLQQEIRSSQLEYQIAVWRILTPDQRLLVGVPSHRFLRGQSKGSGLRWDKGAGKRGERPRDDKWQKNRKKKSFGSD